MANFLNICRSIFNAEITNLFLKFSNRIYLEGNFKNWNIALKASKNNYFSKKIIKKVKFNFLKSLKSKYIYERDGILLNKNIFEEDNIIKHYKKYYLYNNANCRILDVGGGTGSIYFKNQDFIEKEKNIYWVVFDQSQIVSFVKKKIKNKKIKFTSNLTLKKKYNIILIQCSLQYFSQPYNLLNKLTKINSKFIIIDEVPLTNNQNDKIKIQINPNKIYHVNYPLFIFSQKKIKEYLKKKNFRLFYEKNCNTGIGGYKYKCLAFIRNKKIKKKIY
jgi:putative methyltransferase (TIGR04325 family)